MDNLTRIALSYIPSKSVRDYMFDAKLSMSRKDAMAIVSQSKRSLEYKSIFYKLIEGDTEACDEERKKAGSLVNLIEKIIRTINTPSVDFVYVLRENGAYVGVFDVYSSAKAYYEKKYSSDIIREIESLAIYLPEEGFFSLERVDLHTNDIDFKLYLNSQFEIIHYMFSNGRGTEPYSSENLKVKLLNPFKKGDLVITDTGALCVVVDDELIEDGLLTVMQTFDRKIDNYLEMKGDRIHIPFTSLEFA